MGSGFVPSDKPRITLYLSEDLKKVIEEWAEGESRSVSAQIGHFMNQWLIDKSTLVIEPPRELRQRLEEMARARGMPVESLVLSMLFKSIREEI
jgi:hypothetical protein